MDDSDWEQIWATALEYDPELHEAPTVSAAGGFELAQKLCREARRWGVPIIESEKLAQALRTLDVAEQIPQELYADVARILCSINSKKRVNR